jgi:DNA helicase II / ATP-dependent DNA helicase PcrA
MGSELFETAYELVSKNDGQKKAVDTTEGPLLVIAGPGTGKTQILSVRVGKILQNNPTILPSNVLCLTFTETGAANMRERLTRFIGQDAYNVTISTYHAFGGDLIRRFPEYFTETRLQNPIDDLGKYQIVSEIVEAMSYRNPLKQTRHHLYDLISTISEVKRALLSSDDLRAIAKENLGGIQAVNTDLAAIFSDFKIMPRKLDVALPYFAKTRESLVKNMPKEPVHMHLGSLVGIAIQQLDKAIEEAEAMGKPNALTVWKNKWLAKNSDNQFILAGGLETLRIEALADVLDAYEASMHERGLYDFDDMILRAIEVLEHNNDLKYTLQEQYLYILLDEFQDTNASQLRLVQLLTDNPVHEGKPNVMAVGDDDQAIYAFQGAQYSNMVDFHELYKDVEVVNLSANYRSHQNILHTAEQVAEQIDARVFTKLAGMTKKLIASNDGIPEAEISRTEFASDIAQYDWIADQIEQKIENGVKPSEIAVLAPRHKQLEPLVAYLNDRNIPLRYEKRENILETPVVRQVIVMAQLVQALIENNISRANALWPQVLSFDFWQISTSDIWQLSWEIAGKSNDERPNWSKALLESDNQTLRAAALLFLAMANVAGNESYENILDYLIGNAKIDTGEKEMPHVASPLRDYYLSSETQQQNPSLFYDTISHLTVLRAKLREHQGTVEQTLLLKDFLQLIALYEAAEQRMTNTSPYTQDAEAVQLMTVFKAKGLEFEHVFLPSCQDEVWGGSGNGGSNKLTLPANLVPIRHSGTTDDERLRIFFVAITRAKYGLHITSYTSTYAGKATKRLKYLNEQQQEDNSVKTLVLPEVHQAIVKNDHQAPAIESLELDWHARHMEFDKQASLYALLKTRLDGYRLSPTHLNTFTDLIYGGPYAFFFNTLLRFPQAPSIDGQFGNAIHETMEWLQYQIDEHGSLPQTTKVIEYFTNRMKAKKLTAGQLKIELERGEIALAAFMASRSHMFKAGDKAEANFRNENVAIDDVHMAGKIDRMEINKDTKTIVVVDYKTGKSFSKWANDAKLHKYKQQLYCYKLLIENSQTYRDYTVTEGRLEFIEPNADNQVVSLQLQFEEPEMEHIKKLLKAMWQHVQSLQFPDTHKYQPTIAGIKTFEAELLENIN